MNQSNTIAYKGHLLSATALPEQETYAATLVVRAPSGAQRGSGVLGRFASSTGAVRYAFAYGMATIDSIRTS